MKVKDIKPSGWGILVDKSKATKTHELKESELNIDKNCEDCKLYGRCGYHMYMSFKDRKICKNKLSK